MPLFRSRAEQKVRDAGYDPVRLPPGQYLTEKWPVLHAGSVPSVDIATWDFSVWGEVENPIALTYDELKALPQTELTTDIHCVTRWSRFDTSFRASTGASSRSSAAEADRTIRGRSRRAGLHVQPAAGRRSRQTRR